MRRAHRTLAVGLILVVIGYLVVHALRWCTAVFVAVWLCWALLRKLGPIVFRFLVFLGEKAFCFWEWLIEDPIERAQREATKEIEEAVRYYVDVQRQVIREVEASED